MQIVIDIAIFLVSAIIFTFVGMAIRKKVAESKLGSAEEEARKIINLAQKEAENKKKEEIFKAKEEIMNSRKDLDNEIRERRSEVQQQERRLLQKEENLENKMEHIERKEQEIENKKQELENKKQEISKFLYPIDTPKPYTISGEEEIPIGTISSSLIIPSLFTSLYFMSPGIYSPYVWTGEFAISSSSMNSLSAINP